MAIKIEKTVRTFEIQKGGKTTTLSDPNPQMSIPEVADFYSIQYPELLNSNFEQKEKDGNLVITFKSIAGTKG